MKKLLILVICSILLLVQLFSAAIFVSAAEGIDIILSNYSINKNAVYENNDFILTMLWSNNSGDVLSDVIVEIDSSSSSFFGTNTNTVKIADIQASASNVSVPLNLTYKGTGRELKLNVKYKKGSSAVQYEQSLGLTIKNATETNNTPPPAVSTDTSKYAPKLASGKVSSEFTAVAGSSNTLTIPVSNVGVYAARSVVITLEMEDKSKTTQLLDNLNMVQSVQQILPNESKNIVFDLKLVSTAPEGVYAFKLNYSFENFYNDSYTSSESFYIKVVNSNTSPRLVADSIETAPSVAVPGENLSLKVKISNLGTLPAKNVKVTLKGLKNNGFITNNSTDVKYITQIDGGGSAYVTYSLKATAGIPSGSNELQVKIEYTSGNDGTVTADENQIFIPVSRTGAGKGLIIKNIKTPGEAVTANKDFKLVFEVTNTGLSEVSNIKVSLSSDKEIICKSMNSIMVDSLGKGETKKCEFTLYASQDAVTKNYPVAINVEYDEPQGDTAAKATLTQYAGIFVENDGSSKSVPRIIIDKYSYEPTDIKSGDEFTLKMSFLNTSRTVNISNIKVTVSSDDGTFTPVNSSNTFFIDQLASKKNLEKVLVLKAKPGAEQKSYALSINFDYEDDKGTQYNTKETISIPVLQVPRLVTGDIMMPTDAFTQQPFPVSVEFYNMGKVTLYNLLVKAEGDFTVQNGRYFVGNFDSGRSDSFEVQVTPKAAGELKGNIVFSFEDSAGKTIEVKKDFTVNVTEMPVEKPVGGMGGLGPDGKPLNANTGKGFNILYVAIPAGAVILGVVLFIVIRKKRIRRREMSLDE